MSRYGGITSPTTDELLALRAVAAGQQPADLAIRGGKVIFVHTGEIRQADILISGRRIAAVTQPGHLKAEREYDATGYYVAPTFIESHLHIEYTLLPPGELARLIVPKGTSTILADPNCSAAVLGRDGIDFISHTSAPLRIFLQISSEIPNDPALEIGGATLTPAERAALLADPRAVSLGESNPFSLDEAHAADLAAAFAHNRRATGHTARLANEPLWAYVAGGIGDDHNAATFTEVLDRIRLGLAVTIQASSMSDYCEAILGDHSLLGLAAHHICFCADDKHVIDLAEGGHIDHHVRQAVALGVDPALAIRMGSLNAALHYRIDQHTGSITPTRFADFQLLPDLVSFQPKSVFVGGQEVARDGKALFENTDPLPQRLRHTVRINLDKTRERVAVTTRETSTVTVRAAEIFDGYYNREFEATLPVVNGVVHGDPENDVAKIVVVDRHHATGQAGVGFVKGFGLRRGALAASSNCANQNIVAIGTTDDDIITAVEALAKLGGGYVAVDEGRVVGQLALPIMGLMSDQPWEDVLQQLKAIDRVAQSFGCPIDSPFMILSFVGLPAVPDLGLTECGLIDAKTQRFVSLIKDQPLDRASAVPFVDGLAEANGATTSGRGWQSVPQRDEVRVAR